MREKWVIIYLNSKFAGGNIREIYVERKMLHA